MGAQARERGARRRLGLEGVGTLVQTLALVGAGAWAVYTFIYEARIKPGLEPPAVSVKTDLTRVGERGDRVAIRASVTRTNVGQTGVRVLGLTYTVTGLRARFGPEGAAERAAAFRAALPGAATVEWTGDYRLESGADTIVLRQGVLFAGAAEGPAEPSELNPGEAVTRDLILYADRARFDAVRVQVGLAYGKEDEPPVRLRFDTQGDGTLTLVPVAPCPETNCPLKTTDFATEFSLW